MIKKISGLSAFFLYHILTGANMKCKVENMYGEFPMQVCRDLKNLQNGVIGQDNQRLFQGAAGTGKRTLAQQYAKKANGHFVEYCASELLNGYLKIGNSYFLDLLETIRKETEKQQKTTAFLYIYDVDKINDSLEQLAALERLRIETARCNNDNSKIKIFVIFAVYHTQSKSIERFINRLNGPYINFEMLKSEDIRKIFFKYCCEEEVINSLNAQICNLKEQGIFISDFAKEIEELQQLETKLIELDKQLWTKKNPCQLWGKTDFEKAKIEIIKICKILSSQAKDLAAKWQEKMQHVIEKEKNFCSIQQELYETKQRSYLNRSVLYEVGKSKYSDIVSVFHKDQHRSSHIFPVSYIKKNAKKILQAAFDENNGIITDDILNRNEI